MNRFACSLMVILAGGCGDDARGEADPGGAGGGGAGGGGAGGEGTAGLSFAGSGGVAVGGGGSTSQGQSWEDAVWVEEHIGGGLRAREVAVAPDGTIYVCGGFLGPVTFDPSFAAADGQVFLLSFDEDGTLLATRQLGVAEPQASCAGLGVQPDGTVIAVGSFSDDADLGSGALSAEGDDIFVAAFDPGLAPLWSTGFGGVGDQRANHAVVGADGSIVIGGEYDGELTFGGVVLPSTPAGALRDGFVAKLDSDANGAWAWPIGGDDLDAVRAVAIAPGNGDVVLSGSATGDYAIAGGPVTTGNNFNGYVARLTASGDHVFDHRLGISVPSAVAAMPDGGMVLGFSFGGTQVIAGVTLSAPPFEVDMATVRFDPMGTPIAVMELEVTVPPGSLMPYPPEEEVTDLVVDDAGNVVMTGHAPVALDFGDGPIAAGGMYVARLTPELAIEWTDLETSHPGGFGQALAIHPNGNIIAVGDGWTSTDNLMILVALSP